jgi:hypothetical protein
MLNFTEASPATAIWQETEHYLTRYKDKSLGKMKS